MKSWEIMIMAAVSGLIAQMFYYWVPAAAVGFMTFILVSNTLHILEAVD